ncbi:MAG: alpha/beta hydrolase-fold protein [Pseudomonadota bacterium]
MTLHLVTLPVDLDALAAAAGDRGWTLGHVQAFDEGAALHHFLAETFGPRALQPFRLLVAPRKRRGRPYAYTQQDPAAVLETAQSAAVPEIVEALPIHEMRSRAMPINWRAGRRLGFDVRLPPVVRPASARPPPTDRTGRRHHRFAKAAEVDAFIARGPFPRVSPGNAQFAFRGNPLSVELVRWIHAGVSRSAFIRVPGTDLWLLDMKVADNGRFEYKLSLQNGGHEEWIIDPLNPSRAADPFGENSVCQTYGYERPAWTLDRGNPQGQIEPVDVVSEVFGEIRREHVYLPPNYDPAGAYKLVVIHDGDDFVTYADLSASLDNLIAAGDIPPVVAALVQTRDRMGEYPRGRRHARYIVQECLPELSSRYAVSEAQADRVMLGASLGAVASLSTAVRFPGVFGGLVLQSGSFILDERKLRTRAHPVFHRVARLVRALKRAPQLPHTRAFISTGELEGLADDNRALAHFLKERGMDVEFRSAWDGHHWHNWRDQLRDGLMWTLNVP